MKVVLINTYSQNGGAAIACQRLLNAHLNNGVDAKMLVQEKTSEQPQITALANSYWQKKKAFARFALERLYFLPHEKDKSVRFAFSPARIGTDISQHPLVQEADILHLHWVNFGFLSLKTLQKLFALKKPIVWTLHDMWAFTGGCHYAGDCHHYEVNCGNCHFLKKPQQKDLSHQVYQQKQVVFENTPISFVTCSHWLKTMAEKSSLLKDKSVFNIPNPIDTHAFQPVDKNIAREAYHLPKDKFLVLFGAMNVADPRKGFLYLKQAFQLVAEKYPNDDIELVVFGKAEESAWQEIPFKVHSLGKIQGVEQLRKVYSLADVFVLPSLEDNLPNTIMEAMACATPCVAFDTGGLPEMIDHEKNGFLASYKSATDLVEGILYVKNNPTILGENAREKVLNAFSEQKVSKQYADLYEEVRKK